MSDIHESELNAFLRLNYYFHLITSLLSLVMKIVLAVRYGFGYFSNPFFHFLLPTAFLLYSFLLRRLNRCSIFVKQCTIFLGTEIFLLMIKRVSYDIYDHRVVAAFFATGAVMSYQARIVTSPAAILLVGVKHLFQWYLFDVLYEEKVAFHPYTIIFMIGFLFLMHVQGSFRRGYMKDIKDFKFYLEQNNKNIKRLIKTLQSGLVTFDQNFSTKHINPKATELLECNKSELIRTLSTLRFYRSDQSDDFVLTRIQDRQVMRLNSNCDIGSVLVSGKHISLNLSKIEWGDSFILVLLLTDVTNTVDLETSILENELKSRFLNFIPHELQTPTVGILGCTENLIDLDPDLSISQVKSSLEIVLCSSRKLHTMICNISDYTQIISGHFFLERTSKKLSGTIENALQVVRASVKSHKLTIRARIDPYIPEFIETDHQRLLQVLTILLCNSMKYTYKGFIEVVALLENSQLLKIEINDSGIGITNERLLFINEQLRNPQSGVLLFGLEVSDSICRRLGGFPLNISSEIGTSISFYIELSSKDLLVPISEEVSSFWAIPDESANLIEIREFSLSKTYCQVLIVDDTESSREVLARILERERIPFLEARDGKEAIRVVKERDRRNNSIQLIVMDIDMPVMDGWEATKRIFGLVNSNKISNKPFIVGYSAFTAPSVIEKAHSAGMISYIKKPARVQDILRVIKSLLK